MIQARIWDVRRLETRASLCDMRHRRVVNSAYFSPLTGSKILTTSQDNRIGVWDSIYGDLESPSREIVHSHDFNRHLTCFRAEWDPKDPSESLAVIGRYISENYNGVALHPIDFIDTNTGQLVAEVMEPNITTISPVNKLHPRDDIMATGSSRRKESSEPVEGINKRKSRISICGKDGKKPNKKSGGSDDDSDGLCSKGKKLDGLKLKSSRSSKAKLKIKGGHVFYLGTHQLAVTTLALSQAATIVSLVTRLYRSYLCRLSVPSLLYFISAALQPIPFSTLTLSSLPQLTLSSLLQAATIISLVTCLYRNCLCHPSAHSLLCSISTALQPLPFFALTSSSLPQLTLLSLPHARSCLCPLAPSLLYLKAFVSYPADAVVSTLSFTTSIFPSLPTSPPLSMPDRTNKLLAGKIRLIIFVFLIASIPTLIPSLIDSSP
ncbi:DNA damage-binding protein 2 [Asimina triloba]